jgi:uncharacterized repeat protein (TIGR03803 family)
MSKFCVGNTARRAVAQYAATALSSPVQTFIVLPSRPIHRGYAGKGCMKLASMMILFCVATAIASRAQTFTSLLDFNGPDGAHPWYGTLVQGLDGNFYGTTNYGGANNAGTVFKMTPTGALTTLYDFCSQANCADGEYPQSGLVMGTDGNFYGGTQYGGTNCAVQSDCSTLFKVTPEGQLTTLDTLCINGVSCTEGVYPNTMILGTDGNFYGTTYAGGVYGGGTVFKMTPQGTVTYLYSFCAQSNCADGSSPLDALVQASNGNFYGTTWSGGNCPPYYGCGTIFEITPAGKFTLLFSFTPSTLAGTNPYAPLVQGRDGNFYGTANTDGIFKMTPNGKVTNLYTLCSLPNCADGELPYAGLIQATDGNFFGTTSRGGANSSGGTIFEITSKGQLTTLYSFCSQTNCADGAGPLAGLLQATNGTFYGTTTYGGTVTCSFSQCGNAFSLSLGLAPFVATVPTAGAVGTSVTIMGNHLTGTTGVTFNGTAASFTVVSSTEITATVPAGATTGRVKVEVPNGTLKGNAAFRILK